MSMVKPHRLAHRVNRLAKKFGGLSGDRLLFLTVAFIPLQTDLSIVRHTLENLAFMNLFSFYFGGGGIFSV